jgi:hypothetical protein
MSSFNPNVTAACLIAILVKRLGGKVMISKDEIEELNQVLSIETEPDGSTTLTVNEYDHSECEV